MQPQVSHGLPTYHNGILMRSRLEAKWARFMDLIGWEWHYEPNPLEGYLPDFMLTFPKPLLLEVKPASSVDELNCYRDKIENSGWTGEALLVGTGVFDALHDHPIVGIIGERTTIDGQAQWLWSPARLFGCLACDGISLLADCGSWHCRRCNARDGNAHIESVRNVVLDAWAEVTNRTQWRGAFSGSRSALH